MSSDKDTTELVQLSVRKTMLSGEIWARLDMEQKRKYLIELEKLAEELGVDL